MTALHEMVNICVRQEANDKETEWLPELPESVDQDQRSKFSDNDAKLTRKQLRLLVDSAVAALRIHAEEQNEFAQFHHVLARIRNVNSSASAVATNRRLLTLFDMAVEERGENAGSEYSSAATLSDWLIWSYNGWPITERHFDAADHYAAAVGSTALNSPRRGIVLQLLRDLKALDPQ